MADLVATLIRLFREAWPILLVLAALLALLLLAHRKLTRAYPGSRLTRVLAVVTAHPTTVIALLGNAFVLLVCVQFASYIEPGGRGRPMMEAALFGAIGLCTLLLGLSAVVWEFAKGPSRKLAVVGLILCLAPYPLSGYLLNAIAQHYSYSLAP